jgi:hypothetical protein
MTKPPEQNGPRADHLIKECVRGLRPWASLEGVGITIDRSKGSEVYSNLSGQRVAVFPEDLAEGLIRLSGDLARLREWADILLGASTVVELRLEGHPYGEALLEALWELSAGEPIRESAVLAARELYVD